MDKAQAWDWGKTARNSTWIFAAILVGIGSTLFSLEVLPDGSWSLDGNVLTASAFLWAAARAGMKWVRVQAGDQGLTRFL